MILTNGSALDLFTATKIQQGLKYPIHVIDKEYYLHTFVLRYWVKIGK